MRWPRQGVTGALREIYRIRQFRLDSFRDANFQALETMIRTEVATGSYDFLPCPPVVFLQASTTKITTFNLGNYHIARYIAYYSVLGLVVFAFTSKIVKFTAVTCKLMSQACWCRCERI